MMHQQISRKIIIYLFLFIIFTSINNFKYLNSDFYKINQINIAGLSNIDNDNIYYSIDHYKKKNIFFLDNYEISKKIYSNQLVEKFWIFKKYPSTLDINLTKTNFLGRIKIDNIDYLIGSNGKYIKKNKDVGNIPFVSGNIKINDFLILKEIVDKSNFDFNKIDSLYYFKSDRWDFKTKKGLIIRLPSQLNINLLNKVYQITDNMKFKHLKVIDFRQKNKIITNE